MSEALLADSLASHLVVATAFALIFGVATALPPRPITLRWAAAAVPVVGLRLTLVALLLVGAWGYFDTRFLVSWLEWFAAVVTMLATGWVLLLPRHHPRWDSWLLGIVTLLVVGLSVSVGVEQLAGNIWPVILWGGFGLVLGLVLIVLLPIGRVHSWPVYMLAFTSLSAGLAVDALFGTGVLRPAESIVYPLAAIFIQQRLIRSGVAQAVRSAGGSGRKARPASIDSASQPIALATSPEPPQQVETLKAELRLALEELAEVSSQPEREDPIPVGSLTALIQGMREPLASIQEYGEMLAGGGTSELSPDQRRFVDRVNDNVARATQQLARLDGLVRGGEPPKEGLVDVIAAVETAVAQVAGNLKERDQSLHLELAENLPAIKAGPDEVRQILVTLIENAIQASPRGAVIPVSALATDAADGAWVSLSVSDSGGGITPEDLGRVFQSPEPGRGAESGLARVKLLAEGMGGRVWVGSEVGGGSTVTVLIPAGEG